MQGMEVIMTFEEWFEDRFPRVTAEGSAARLGSFKEYLEEAWEAGYAEGVEAMGGPVDL